MADWVKLIAWQQACSKWDLPLPLGVLKIEQPIGLERKHLN